MNRTDLREWGSSCRRFVRTLQDDGHARFGPLVERLFIFMTPYNGWHWGPEEMFLQDPDQVIVPFPAGLAARLSAIKDACFQHGFLHAPPSLRALVETVASRPTLTRLILISFVFEDREQFKRLIGFASSLKTIKIVRPDFCDDEAPSPSRVYPDWPGWCANLTEVEVSTIRHAP